MPSQVSSSDSNDLASKYNHLLQPIRDLTKNWDIDVAAQLEEYLAEIERIKISFDGGKTSMNFAEAALLIQGSACIYSKKSFVFGYGSEPITLHVTRAATSPKQDAPPPWMGPIRIKLVEYLYTLVYQTLDLIASKKRLQQASSVDDQGKDKDASFRDDSVEFLLLDDIKEAKNIDLKEDESDSHKEGSQIIPRTPLVLLPLGEKDKEDVLLSRTGEVLGSRNDFKMNTCRVHASGTLLLDLTNLPLLDNSFKPLLSSAASSASKDPEPVFDEQHANLDPENEGNFEVVDLPAVDDDFEEPELMDDNDFTGENRPGENDIENEQERQEERRALRARGTPQFATVNNLPVKDPWKLLDPYDPGVWKDKPSKKGKPFRKPSSLVSQQKKKRKRQEIKKEPVLIPINQFISQAYYSHASKMVKNPLKTPAFPEFEYLYWIEFRRQQKVQAKQKQLLSQLAVDEEIEELKSIVVKPEEEDGVANEEPGFDDDQVAADYDDDDFVGGDGLPLVEGDVPATIEPMGLEDLAEGVVVSSYEELVRQYVDGYLIEAQQYAQETDLSRRVRNWEDRILPILSEEETHRPFDIHKYGEEIMTSFKEKSNQAFRELAHGKETFEICRLFLATLQLANNYNVEITADGIGEKAVDTMKLKLMKVTPGNQAIATFRGHLSP